MWRGEAGRKESPGQNLACLTFSFRRIICYAIKAPTLIILRECQLEYSTFHQPWSPGDGSSSLQSRNFERLEANSLKITASWALGSQTAPPPAPLFGQLVWVAPWQLSLTPGGPWWLVGTFPPVLQWTWHLEPEAGIWIKSAYGTGLCVTWNSQTPMWTRNCCWGHFLLMASGAKASSDGWRTPFGWAQRNQLEP